MREHENEFRQAGGTLAAIGLGDMHYARVFRVETGITFPLFVDAGRVAYKAAELNSGNLLHKFRRENAEARTRAKSAGFRQHRLGSNPFQLGASFIFGPGNRDFFIHFNQTFSDDADIGVLRGVLESHSK